MDSLSDHPLVLVHGLWDSPRIFDGLVKRLEPLNFSLLTPSLPHNLGKTSIRTLAKELDKTIVENFGSEINIDLLGFSMGGLISRVWLQDLGGALRTSRFISVGTPHKGTLAAQLVPSSLFSGIAEMKKGSSFLRELNNNCEALHMVECLSFYCFLDLMVFPGWQAKLDIGYRSSVSVLTHKQLISNPNALDVLQKAIIKRRD